MSRSTSRGRLSSTPSLRSAESARAAGHRRGHGRGQALAEFALIIPLFILLLTAVIEFALLFNSYLAINFASRDASLIAAEAGNAVDADCLILQAIENSVSGPSDRSKISQVRIFRADRAGKATADVSTYVRAAPTACALAGGGSIAIPYQRTANGYPPANRCNRINGCGLTPTSPADIDQVGVEVTYVYSWHTPLGGMFGGSGGQTTLVKGNVMRMEPVL